MFKQAGRIKLVESSQRSTGNRHQKVNGERFDLRLAQRVTEIQKIFGGLPMPTSAPEHADSPAFRTLVTVSSLS